MKNLKIKKYESDKNNNFKTICNTCKKVCEVPFKPNDKKPVFCDDCFKNMREPIVESTYVRRKDKTIFDTPKNFIAPSSLSQNVDTGSAIMQIKRELASANAKLDKLIDMFNKLK